MDMERKFRYTLLKFFLHSLALLLSPSRATIPRRPVLHVLLHAARDVVSEDTGFRLHFGRFLPHLRPS